MYADATAKQFNEWLQQARPKLLRLAQSRLGQRAEAEDVVQETAISLWRRLQTQPIENWDAYAAKAVWQNALKRRARRRDWVELDEQNLPAQPHQGQALQQAWHLERAIQGLPAAQQAVLRLRFYAGLSIQETAAALSIGLNTAASRCRYALQALRLALDPHPKEKQNEPK